MPGSIEFEAECQYASDDGIEIPLNYPSAARRSSG